MLKSTEKNVIQAELVGIVTFIFFESQWGTPKAESFGHGNLQMPRMFQLFLFGLEQIVFVCSTAIVPETFVSAACDSALVENITWIATQCLLCQKLCKKIKKIRQSQSSKRSEKNSRDSQASMPLTQELRLPPIYSLHACSQSQWFSQL